MQCERIEEESEGFHFPFPILQILFLFFCKLYFSCSKSVFVQSCKMYLNAIEEESEKVRGFHSPFHFRRQQPEPTSPSQAYLPPSAPEVVSLSLGTRLFLTFASVSQSRPIERASCFEAPGCRWLTCRHGPACICRYYQSSAERRHSIHYTLQYFYNIGSPI